MVRVVTYLFFLSILFIGKELNSQKTIVYGTVTDASTGEPLPFVNVGFKGTKIGTTTDFDGKYRIETYYVSDSLQISFVGFKPKVFYIKRDQTQEVNAALEEATTVLQAAVITGSKKDENPAHAILKQVIDNKEINNREKLDAYSYEVYNKVEFDLNNITDKFTKRKVFKKFDFIFDYVDTADEKPYLPIFISESVSDFYYSRSPLKRREFIKATKISGVKNESVNQFLGDMYQNINVYDNHINIFSKSFISPITNSALLYYKYYLTDSANIDGNWCYKLEFKPKRKGDKTFEGELWIHDTTFAVKIFDAYLSESANINFVNSYHIKQKFKQVEPEVWLMVLDESVVDINPLETEKGKGIYGRKTTSYKNFKVNQPTPAFVFDGNENITIKDGYDAYDKDYWENARHVKLTDKEKNIYQMIDTMKNLPVVKSYIDIISTIVSGYKTIGKVEIGPYTSFYSFNEVEGHRLSFGMQTSNNFSKLIMFKGLAGYGFRDEKLKYTLGTKFFITKKPRRLVSIDYTNEIKQVGQDYFGTLQQNIISSFLRRNPNNKLLNVEGFRFNYFNEWYEGFSNTIEFQVFNLEQLNDLLPYYSLNTDSSLTPNKSFNNTEISVGLRYAHNEKFLSGEFNRVSLGTTYPTFELTGSFGVRDVLGGEFNYQKVKASMQHWFNVGHLGYLSYKIEGGKIFGKLPYPLLFVHQGNESWGYSRTAFNAMNIGEFISDEYVSLIAEHHLEGAIFNKFPLLRRLKWREVFGIKAIYGRLDDKHQDIFVLPSFSRSLADKPYAEGSIGIENIFRFLRIDALWRLTYINNNFEDISVLRFGIRGRIDIKF